MQFWHGGIIKILIVISKLTWEKNDFISKSNISYLCWKNFEKWLDPCYIVYAGFSQFSCFCEVTSAKEGKWIGKVLRNLFGSKLQQVTAIHFMNIQFSWRCAIGRRREKWHERAKMDERRGKELILHCQFYSRGSAFHP